MKNTPFNYKRIAMQIFVVTASVLMVSYVWIGSAPSRPVSSYGIFDALYFVPDTLKTFYNKLHYYASLKEHDNLMNSIISVIAGGLYYKIAVFIRARKAFSSIGKRCLYELLTLLAAFSISMFSFELISKNSDIIVVFCSISVLFVVELVIFRSVFQKERGNLCLSK